MNFSEICTQVNAPTRVLVPAEKVVRTKDGGLLMRRTSKNEMLGETMTPLQYTVRAGLASATRKLLEHGAESGTLCFSLTAS